MHSTGREPLIRLRRPQVIRPRPYSPGPAGSSHPIARSKPPPRHSQPRVTGSATRRRRQARRRGAGKAGGTRAHDLPWPWTRDTLKTTDLQSRYRTQYRRAADARVRGWAIAGAPNPSTSTASASAQYGAIGSVGFVPFTRSPGRNLPFTPHEAFFLCVCTRRLSCVCGRRLSAPVDTFAVVARLELTSQRR